MGPPNIRSRQKPFQSLCTQEIGTSYALLKKSITGTVYHETLRPPPLPDNRDGNDDGFAVDTLPGDGNPEIVTARLESYRSKCDNVVRSFALTEGAEGGGTADAEQKKQQQRDGGDDGVFQWSSGGIAAMGGVREKGRGRKAGGCKKRVVALYSEKRTIREGDSRSVRR